MYTIEDRSMMLKSLMFPVVLFLSLAAKCAKADCQLPTPVTEIAETDSKDTVLLEFTITPGESWTLTDPLPNGYIQLTTDSNYFSLTLLRDIDLDNKTSGIDEANMITLELVCSRPGFPPVQLPFRVIVNKINEYSPEFIDEPLSASIPEQSPGDSVVIVLLDHVIDRDYPASQIEGFELYPYLTNKEEDGLDMFYLNHSASGVISLRPEAHLDYETLAKQARTFFMLNISVQDTGYPASFTIFSTLRIDVTDVDDNGPVFVYSCPADCTTCLRVKGFCRVHAYSATASVNGLGPIIVYPAPVKAIDLDTLDYGIEYSMTVITPSVSPHFIINSQTGVVSQVRSLEDIALSVTSVRAFLEAKEISPTGYGSTSTFPIEIGIERSAPSTQQQITTSNIQETGTGFSISNNPDDTFTNPDGSPVDRTANSGVTTVNTTEPNGLQESVKDEDEGIKLWIILAILGGIILVVLIIAVIVIILIKREKRQKMVAPSSRWAENDVTSPKLDRYVEDEILDAYREESGPVDPNSSCNSSQKALIADSKTTNFSNGKLRNDLADPNIFVVPTQRASQLPPLGHTLEPELPPVNVVLKDVGTDTINIKRQRRRRDKEKEEPDVFDGTVDYDMGANTTFYTDVYKTKIKRSPRKAKIERLNPSYWVTVKDAV